jgi:hypothetical protein
MVYLLRLAMRPWRVAPLSQIFSALVVGFLVLFSGFLFWMEQGLKPIVDRLQGEQVITAWLSPDVLESDEQALLKQVKDTVLSAPGPRSRRYPIDFRFTSGSDFLKQIEKPYPELARRVQETPGEIKDLVPRYITLSGVFEDRVLEQVKTIRGIESAESSKNRHTHVVGAYRALRWVVRILVAGLALALLTGLIHLARMNAHLHRDALSILRLWGAGPWTLRSPALVSGGLVGLLGGLTSLGGWHAISPWLIQNLKQLSPMLSELQVPQWQAGISLWAAGIAIGVISGSAGAWSVAGGTAGEVGASDEVGAQAQNAARGSA